MRRPDFVMAWRPNDPQSSARWLFLDAKYQAGEQGLSGSMESLHIYRDALRWEGHGGSSRGGVLLAPCFDGAESYFDNTYLSQFGIGIMHARPDQPISMQLVIEWALAKSEHFSAVSTR